MYKVERGSSEGTFLYLRNKRTGKCPRFNLQWKWQSITGYAMSGVECRFFGFSFTHSKIAPLFELYAGDKLGWRLAIGKVDTDWNGCKGFTLRRPWRKRNSWQHWGWGVTLHEPFLRGKWSDNIFDNIDD